MLCVVVILVLVPPEKVEGCLVNALAKLTHDKDIIAIAIAVEVLSCMFIFACALVTSLAWPQTDQSAQYHNTAGSRSDDSRSRARGEFKRMGPSFVRPSLLSISQ